MQNIRPFYIACPPLPLPQKRPDKILKKNKTRAGFFYGRFFYGRFFWRFFGAFFAQSRRHLRADAPRPKRTPNPADSRLRAERRIFASFFFFSSGGAPLPPLSRGAAGAIFFAANIVSPRAKKPPRAALKKPAAESFFIPPQAKNAGRKFLRCAEKFSRGQAALPKRLTPCPQPARVRPCRGKRA